MTVSTHDVALRNLLVQSNEILAFHCSPCKIKYLLSANMVELHSNPMELSAAIRTGSIFCLVNNRSHQCSSVPEPLTLLCWI